MFITEAVTQYAATQTDLEIVTEKFWVQGPAGTEVQRDVYIVRKRGIETPLLTYVNLYGTLALDHAGAKGAIKAEMPSVVKNADDWVQVLELVQYDLEAV